MAILMIVTLVGISVAGLAAILAIWMERDPRRPAKFAAALSVLILMATGVMILQSIIDERDQVEKEKVATAKQDKLEGDIARMMQTLDRLASESDDPQLQAFMATELEAQARTNPEVVQKLAQRFSDDGKDPAEKLGKHLSASEVEKIDRKGHLKTKKKAKKIKTTEKKKVDKKKDQKEEKDSRERKKDEADAKDGDTTAADLMGVVAPRGIVIPVDVDKGGARGKKIDGAGAKGGDSTVAAPMGVVAPRGIGIPVDDGKKDEKAKKTKKKTKKAKKKTKKVKKKAGGLTIPSIFKS